MVPDVRYGYMVLNRGYLRHIDAMTLGVFWR